MHTSPHAAPVQKRRLQNLLLASLATAALTLLPITSAQAGDREVFDQGHVDAFNVEAKDGGLALDLKEDITGAHVHHAPETVELHVKSAAKATVPDGVPGAGEGYFLPATQDANLLWPGWDTLGTQADGVGKSVKINFTDVEGPGKIHLFGSGQFGGVSPLLEGGATELTDGAVRNQEYPAHTHANWVFSKPGVYTLKVKASGTVNGKAVDSNEATYTFTVGDDFRGATNKPAPKPEKPQPEQPTPDNPAPGDDTTTPEKPADPAPSDPTTEAPAKPEKPAPKPKAPAARKTPKAPKSDAPAQKPSAPVKAAPKQPSKPAHSQTTAKAPKASTPVAPKKAAAPAAPKQEAPAAAANDAPAADAQKSAPVCTASEQVRDATAAEVKGATKTSTSTSSTSKAGGSYTVPANTHTHPNWVFSKPGNYKVTVRQSVKTKEGKNLSVDSTLNFSVGPNASGITSGHFDFGPRVEGGKLVPSIKDDRSSPAKWAAPGSFTFALNNAAKAKAPAGIEFVAPQGSDVWMVPGAQIAGVPWLGANSMHPSVIQNTTGEVTMSLVSVSGPGNMAVFTSGNFGQVVGAKWFSSTAGTATKTTTDTSAIAKDRASAKPGQVFKDGDKHKVLEIVGKTKSGDDCQLTADQIVAAGGSDDYAAAVAQGGSGVMGASDAGGANDGSSGPLPRTGIEAGALTALAVSLIGAGGVAVARKRRA